MTSTPRAHLPPRLLPVLCFGAAHVALALAFGAVALDPRGVSGFFHHSRMLGIVHLVTLGWITASILGSLHLVGPIALRMWIPATWLAQNAMVDATERLRWHNHGPCGYTVAHRPWSIAVSIEFPTEEAAIRFERYLKSGSGRAFAKRHFGPSSNPRRFQPATETFTSSITWKMLT